MWGRVQDLPELVSPKKYFLLTLWAAAASGRYCDVYDTIPLKKSPIHEGRPYDNLENDPYE